MTATTSKPLPQSEATPLGQQLRGLLAFLGSQEFILALGIVLLSLAVYADNPRFGAERNLLSILSNSAYIAVAALGMTVVIITGNIDISVAALLGVLGTIAGQLAVHDYPIWLAWLAPIVFGILIELFIGFLVAYLRIPAIVATLGMMSVLKGGLIFVTGGAWIYDLPKGFFLAQRQPLGIPMPIYFMFALTLLMAIWMRYSATGRAIYAVGGNREAARLSGISEKRILMTVFGINGLMVGISTILFATQFTTIQSTVPPGVELTIITAAVIGGVSILGGSGTVIGAMLGAILIRTIQSGMIFVNVSAYWLQAVQGLLILLTVLVDIFRRRRQMSAIGK
ncbi:MAG: ABC transporter permease [Chloroflexi bacterium]|nr:ABC transporter permease [Chloroflexota bacterium]